MSSLFKLLSEWWSSKNKNQKWGIVIVFLFMLGLIGNMGGGTTKASNTVGDWYHEVSKNMGGYTISQKTRLTIIRNGPGDYDYNIETTVTDAMYGGQPKSEYSSGKFEEGISNNEWRFSGGDYGNREGYIDIPYDRWDDYKPSEITVRFGSGRGNSMTFKRY